MRLLPSCFALLLAAPLQAADWTWTYRDDATQPVAHRIADDGTTYLVGNTAANTHVVTRLDPDGTVAWRREHAGVWARGTTYPPREPDTDYSEESLTTLGIGSDRLCIFGGGDNADPRVTQTQFAACYRLEDGAALSRFAFDRLRLARAPTFGGVTDYEDSYSLMLPDGGFVSLVAGTTGYDATGAPVRSVRHRRFTATGQLLHDVVVGAHGFTRVDGQDGTVLIPSGRGYHVVDADGVRRFDLDTNGLARRAPDRSFHVVGQVGENTIEWRHLGADGAELSRRTFALCEGCPAPVALHAALQLSLDRSDAFLDVRMRTGEPRMISFGSSSYDVRAFTVRLTGPSFVIERPGFLAPLRLRVDPATGAPIELQGAGFLSVLSRDATTGAELRTRHLTGSTPARLRVSDDGTLRVIAVGTNSPRVFALANAWAARPPTRVDQAGLRGAWYAPYVSGQGIVIEYLPATNTFFIPWFTYAPVDNARTVRDLRWYTLQGRAEPNATRATLDILLNSGGAFASPPETQPSVVGSATLEAYDCDSATLEYDLGGVRQSISLSRLTPPTGPCVLADGTTRGSVPAARDGFDARQSGAWFTRGRAGQGLTFAVQPGGFFFGAWFTYDPATSPDDPATQHWFSLQGDVASATNGSVTLPIYRTTKLSSLQTTTVTVGSATIRFTACDRATLDYRFDADAADAFRGLTGTVALEKLGGCAP